MKPKIVLVLDKMIRAGTQRHVLQLIKGLKDDYTFHVVCLEGYGEWDQQVIDAGAVLHRYPLYRIYTPSGCSTIRCLRTLLKELKPSGMVTFMFTAHVVGTLAARGLPFRVISARREKILWRRWYHLACRRWANRRCTFHLANSKAVAEDVQKEGVPSDHIEVIRNAFEPARGSCDMQLEPDRVHWVVLAALKPVKQHSILLAALEMKRQDLKKVRFHFLGDGPLKTSLQKEVRDRGLETLVTFHGHVDRAPERLSQFDAAVLPSASEGYSNALLECLGAGLPVVAFDVDGNREAIRDGETGYLVPYGDKRKMGDMLLQLTADKQRRDRMGQQAQEDMKKHETIESMCQKTAAIYKKIFSC